jgi:hypothetical protein
MGMHIAPGKGEEGIFIDGVGDGPCAVPHDRIQGLSLKDLEEKGRIG